jgi:hypothetical protein
MRTITVLLHSRPELAAPVTKALIACQDITKFDLVTFSVDHGGMSPVVARSWRHRLEEETGVRTQVQEHRFNRSDLHVQIEDDAVLSPDFLRLALWWEQNKGASLLLNACDYVTFGQGRSGVEEGDPSLLTEIGGITSPYAWATTREILPFLSRWNHRTEEPLGWDWSLREAMHAARRFAMTPVLSRVRNIGAEGGVHETQETWDRTQRDLRVLEAPYEGGYRVVGRLDQSGFDNPLVWMRNEIVPA